MDQRRLSERFGIESEESFLASSRGIHNATLRRTGRSLLMQRWRNCDDAVDRAPQFR